MRETLVVVAQILCSVCPVNAQPNVWELQWDMEVRSTSVYSPGDWFLWKAFR